MVPLKLFAEANVESAHDEEHDYDSDKKQIHHWISFKFSLIAIGATPIGLRLFPPHYGRDQVVPVIKMRKGPVKFS